MKLWQKISYYLGIFLIVLLPIQSLLTNILIQKTNLGAEKTFWLLHCYEPLLLVLLLAGALDTVRHEKYKKIQIIPLIFLFIGFVSILFFSQSITFGLEGGRFTILGVGVFIIFSLFNLKKKKINNLVKVYLIVALVMALISIIEKFLPANYWKLWWGIENFGYGIFKAGDYIQGSSLMAGPNQLGSFLIPAIIFLIINQKNFKRSHKVINIFTVLTLIGSLMLTQSRSAIVGLGVVLLIYWFITSGLKNIYKFIICVTIIAFAIMFVFFFADHHIIGQLITHGGQTGHQDSFFDFIDGVWEYSMREFIIGHGIGSSGPLVLKTGVGTLPESWYLQIFYEVGIIGLIAWLGFIYCLVKQLFTDKLNWLAWAFISVSITNLFLHTWADNPALTNALFIVAGLSISSKSVGAFKNKE